jgi:hypothetical protein
VRVASYGDVFPLHRARCVNIGWKQTSGMLN